MPHRRAINIGQIPHYFAINCNKYYINKSHSVQISPELRGQNADKNPQGGGAIYMPDPPPPLWGLTLIGALSKQNISKQLTGGATGWFPYVCSLKYSCE